MNLKRSGYRLVTPILSRILIIPLILILSGCIAWPAGALGALAGLVGGSDGGGGLFPFLPSSPATVTEIQVTPTNPSIAKGTTQQLAATAIYSDGSNKDVTAVATWSSSHLDVAIVNASGLVNSLTGQPDTGTSTITATYEGHSGSTTLDVTTAVLVSIAVTPDPLVPLPVTVAKGTAQQFKATGTYSDTSTQDITLDPSLTWSSTTVSVATIDATGLTSTLAVGSTTIKAQMSGISSDDSGNSATLNVTSATLVSIAVTPSNPSVALGLTQQFTATGTYTDSSTQNITSSVTWDSSSTGVATIDATGLATTVSVGSTTISASLSGISSNDTTESASLTVTGAALVSIAVTPGTPSVAKGVPQQFTATGTYTDSSTQDITTSVTWSSTSTGVATISNAGGSKGLASTLAEGSTTIKAFDSGSGISSDDSGESATLTVTAATLVSIAVTPSAPSVAKGVSQQFTATGTYTDASNQDITTSVTWSSTSTGVATISNAGGSKGLASTLAEGSTTIKAQLGGVSSDTTGESATLTVTAAVLASIAVTPVSPTVALGLNRQFTATGTYTDASNQDITTSVTWSSTSTGVATISNAGGSQGLASTHATGSTTIKAQLGGISSDTSPGNSAALTVTAATLVSIAVTPASISLAKGVSQQFTATGTYTDSSNQDITTAVTWSSTNVSVATISNAGGSQGLASTLAVGSTTIKASLSGVSSDDSTESATLTVTAATLVSIAVTPASISLAKGLTQQYTATGTYTDSSTQDITTAVTWASSNTYRATVSNAGGTKGLATALNTGAATISASLSGISSNDSTQSATLTVTAATLSSIIVSPDNPTIANGTTKQFYATGVYSDNSVQDLTATVTWSSTNVSAATISNAAGSEGLASSAGVGSTTIQASYSGKSDSTTLNVSSATLLAIAVKPKDSGVDPDNPTFADGTSVELLAIGTYSDNTTQDLTTQVTWSSDATGVATVSNASGSKGVVTGQAPGSANITATLSAISGTLPITVTNATLQSIVVTPNNPIAYGTTQQFKATGNYSDATTQDITNIVTWSSSDNGVATISNAAGSHGLATSVAAGTTTITASLGVSGNTTLEVKLITLVSINVTPTDPSVQIGDSQQFSATGVYSDLTQQDLTTQVTWSSGTTAVATISNGAGSQGLASSVGAGVSSISAMRDGITGSTNLTVNADTTQPTLVSTSLQASDKVKITFSENMKVAAASTASNYKISSSPTGTCAGGDNFSTSSSSVSISSVTVISPKEYVLNLGGSTSAVTYTVLVNQAVDTVEDLAGNDIGCPNTATFVGEDTTPPEVSSVTSLSPMVVRVTFSETMNGTKAQTAANYKIVDAPATGACSDNSNFTGGTQTADFNIVSVSGSGATYDITLDASQSAGKSYTLVVNKADMEDAATVPNALTCPNIGDFTGQEQLKVSTAACVSNLSDVIVSFSKGVVTGVNAAKSAECTGATECNQRYKITGVTDLGDITSVRVLDGVVCNGAAADATDSRFCLTHTNNQSGGVYTVIAANNLDGDGFDNTGWGSIRDSGDTENVQPAPKDRVSFTGCATAPQNFDDGPVSTDPFGDGSSFGFLGQFAGKIYVGPNTAGNSATRMNPDGSSPQQITFTFERDTTGVNTSRNVAGVVSIGHSGCTAGSNDPTTGCGPDNEDGRGLFATGTLGGIEHFFIGGSRSAADFDYIYYTSDTDTVLDYRYIDMGAINGSNTNGFSSVAVLQDRLYAGYARQPNNRPDFSKISFNSGDASYCAVGSSCNVVSGNEGIRFRIDYMSYFGGNAGTGGNWAYYVGVDSQTVFNDILYAAAGGHHRTDHDGGIIRSNNNNPGVCSSADTCPDWTSIHPRTNADWYTTGNSRWSLELNKTYDLAPRDKAFPEFAEFNGNLYVIRNTCTVQGANAEDTATHTVAGCNDGTVTGRQAQLWKCDPTLTGGATTCEAADWSLVAQNGATGITNMGDTNNKVVSLLVANGSRLYIGFDSLTGVEIWRTRSGVTNPISETDFEQVGADGLGDTTNNLEIHSAISKLQSTTYYIYVSTGKSGVPLKVYRQQNN